MNTQDKLFVTADLHFSHKNIIKHCPDSRGHYTNVDDMNTDIIRKWNSKVPKDGTTYILGDVAFCNAVEAVSLLNQLNGMKILIEGNHDKKLLENQDFRNCFSAIYSYHEIKFDGKNIVMFHYPIASWNRMYYGAIHLHGHLHGNLSGLEQYKIMDVGLDNNQCFLYTMQYAVDVASFGRIKNHH